jgi:photosystem II stability/assembly factor-like uncharacterized protein
MKSTLPGLLLSAAVLGAALFAFSPRPVPAFAPTTIQADHLQINGLAKAGTRLVGVGERGVILMSDDAGASWRQAAVATDEASALTQVFFISPRIGIAVGHDGWILRTVDGGAHWSEVHFDRKHSDPLLSVWGNADGLVFASGSFGQLFVSHDAGATWAQQKTPADDRHLNAIAGDASGRLMIAGETGTLLVSTDNGASWEKRPVPYQGSLFGVLKLADGDWLAYGMRGNVHIDSHVGTSYFGAVQLSDGELVLVGQGGAIVTSRDNGQSFSVRKVGGVQSLAAVVDAGHGELALGGEAGIALLPVVPAVRAPLVSPSGSAPVPPSASSS